MRDENIAEKDAMKSFSSLIAHRLLRSCIFPHPSFLIDFGHYASLIGFQL